MKTSTNSEIIAPLCRKNRRRTICACDRPTVSFCSRVDLVRVGGSPTPGSCRRTSGTPGVGCHCPTLILGSSAAYSRSAMMLKTTAMMRDDQEEGHHRVRIAVQQAGLEQPAHRVPLEDGLGDHGAAEQAADVEGDDGGERDERVAEGVPHDDRPLGEALGPGRADVVLVQHLEHAGPGVPGVAGQRDQDQRQRRQQQVGEQVDGVDPEIALETALRVTDGLDRPAPDRVRIACRRSRPACCGRGRRRRPCRSR